ncbi:MAG: Flp pilus assembly protein CpaB [Planctomycetes bacterium]|nr:Flp pilus assembly protein CpaB [Planctomycetota bacterium]
MRPKTMMLLVVALGCGLVAAIGINQTLANREVVAAPAGEMVPVIMALSNIGTGDPLKPENIKLEEFPKDRMPPNAVSDWENAIGRRARHPILPGLPIVEEMLLSKGDNGEDLSGMIAKGMRVVSVRVDAVSGMAGLLKPGDRVDMVVHLHPNPTYGISMPSARTFLQNVKIIAVDDVFRRDNDGQQAVVAKTVSVLVTPAQAELVTLATELGTLRLIMRPADDDGKSETDGASPEELLGVKHSSSEPKPEPDLLGLLNQQKPPMPAEQVPTPDIVKKDVWRMRIFDGSSPREVEFEDGVPRTLSGNSAGDNGVPPTPETKP